jgi:predicted MFS family arabinose efflux permease
MTCHSERPIDATHNNRWIMLLVAFMGLVLYGYAYQSVPPLLLEFQTIFAVDNVTAGLLMSMVVIPGVFLSIPAGLLINKYGFRKLGFISSISIALGSLVTAIQSTFLLALVGRSLVGLSGCFLAVGIGASIARWFSPKEMGKAMALYSIGIPVATTTAYFTVPTIALIYGWQVPFYLSSIFSVVCGIYFLIYIKDTKKIEVSAQKIRGSMQFFRDAEFWKLCIIWMLFTLVTFGFLTWAPTLLFRFKGFTLVSASISSSLYTTAGIFFTPFWGWASDKTVRRKPFIIAGLLTATLAFCCINFFEGWFITIPFIVLSTASSAVLPPLMATAAHMLTAKGPETGFGVLTFWQKIGMAISAPLVGYFLQSTQSMLLTLTAVAIITFFATAVAATLHTK